MKQKIVFTVSVILSFFIGCAGMYLLISNRPLTTETVERVLKEYKVEETVITEAIDRVYDAVVVVESYRNNRKIGTGTGFIYKKDDINGYIITNAHVIGEAETVEIIFSNNKTETATLLGSDIYADIAVLSIPVREDLTTITIGNSEKTLLGSTVFTVGAPMGSDYSGTVTRGILSGKDRIVTVKLAAHGNIDWMMRVLQTDAAINPGNSGGPLLNLAGEVIGINSLKLVERQVEGMGFAIPIEEAMKYVEQLEKGETISRPMLGVKLVDLNESYTLFINGIIVDEEVESGVVVVSVLDDTPAMDAGLQKGDVILQIGNKKVGNRAELRYQLFQHNVGDEIEIAVYRDKRVRKFEIVLADSDI